MAFFELVQDFLGKGNTGASGRVVIRGNRSYVEELQQIMRDSQFSDAFPDATILSECSPPFQELIGS